MKQAQFGVHSGLPDSDAESTRDTHEISLPPRQGEVLAQIGGVIAICLGLALLAHVLIAAPAMQ